MSDEKIKCPKCGGENNASDSFCAECGKNLNVKVQENIVLKGVKTFFVSIGELISFIICATVVSAVFVVAFSEMSLGVCISIVAGLIVTAVIRNTAQMNSLEKKMLEIEKQLQNKE